MDLTERIKLQQENIEKGNPKLELLNSCRIGNGITTLSEEETKAAVSFYEKRKHEIKISFFIPSSGSGSRMFGALYDFLQSQNPDDETIEFIEHLVNSIPEFAFYNKLPQSVKDDLKSGNIDIESFIKLLLSQEGFDFGNRPKGLIPFHRYGNFIINPFQEHILQGAEIGGEKAHFHFTINTVFEPEISHSVKILKEITGIDFFFDFSVQDERTNSIAFDAETNAPIYDENGDLITRPAGHGALLENLNQIDSGLIFIRNIDNIQHQDHSYNSISSRKMLAGVLLEFQEAAHQILRDLDAGNDTFEELAELNQKYDLKISDSDLRNPEKIRLLLNRPIRICGMVKNEGQPGGGPFWVADQDGNETRQIVEKSQISSKSSQIGLLIKSTHFNPVEIICAPKDYQGNKFDLLQFRNDSQYFIVHKTHKGKRVRFIEKPGLWNGGMANWITLFYEINNDCFSPVKTVLDLLKPLHRDDK